MSYPLLSDPASHVIKAYGVAYDNMPFAKRAYFLIGQDGKIKWHTVAKKGILPNATVLESMRKALKK